MLIVAAVSKCKNVGWICNNIRMYRCLWLHPYIHIATYLYWWKTCIDTGFWNVANGKIEEDELIWDYSRNSWWRCHQPNHNIAYQKRRSSYSELVAKLYKRCSWWSFRNFLLHIEQCSFEFIISWFDLACTWTHNLLVSE